MGNIKQLARQTALYGVSSILGRLINYALVPLHTYVFLPDQLGIVTALYAYTALLMILFTFGMETAYFRFAKENEEEAFKLTTTVVLTISTLFSLLIALGHSSIAVFIGYEDAGPYILFIAAILWIDALLAIPFARLRHFQKAKKFAGVKLLNIFMNIVLQSSLLWIIPYFATRHNYIFLSNIAYIFLANLIANGVMILFLFKEIKDIRIAYPMSALLRLLKYATPIFVMGMAGMLIEQLDKIMMEHFIPNQFYSGKTSTETLGIYGQILKLSIFMMLAIQAFRYAGEPFFFSQSEDKKAPALFAKIMTYFSITGLVLFVLVSINVDLISVIFLQNEAYRTALYLVPFLLIAKLLYGIYLNMSIWFKLTDQTHYGIYFTVFGAIITLIGNALLMPILGMLGAAITMIICYLLMCIICYWYGQKCYPIPYSFFRPFVYLIIFSLLILTSENIDIDNFYLNISIRLLISIVIVVSVYLIEKRNIFTKNI